MRCEEVVEGARVGDFFFKEEAGKRRGGRSGGLGEVKKRQVQTYKVQDTGAGLEDLMSQLQGLNARGAK